MIFTNALENISTVMYSDLLHKLENTNNYDIHKNMIAISVNEYILMSSWGKNTKIFKISITETDILDKTQINNYFNILANNNLIGKSGYCSREKCSYCKCCNYCNSFIDNLNVCKSCIDIIYNANNTGIVCFDINPLYSCMTSYRRGMYSITDNYLMIWYEFDNIIKRIQLQYYDGMTEYTVTPHIYCNKQFNINMDEFLVYRGLEMIKCKICECYKNKRLISYELLICETCNHILKERKWRELAPMAIAIVCHIGILVELKRYILGKLIVL